MFAGGAGNMRGPRMKTPLLLLLLLLLLLTTRTGTETPESVSDATEEPKPEEYNENTDAEGIGSGSRPPLNESSDPTEGRNGTGRAAAPGHEEEQEQGKEEEEEGLSLIIILIPAVLAVIIIGMIVCGIFINRRWNQKARNQELRKEDPYLDGSSSEKVPMPMFEEDVPSVLELEMEELDQWMKKDCDPSEDSKLA